MKRRLNIFCVAVFLVLGFSLYNTGYQFGAGIKAGFNLVEKQKAVIEKNHNTAMIKGDYRTVDIVPTVAMFVPDTILNVKTGEQASIMYTRAAIRVSDEFNIPVLVVTSAASMLNVFIMIAALILFVILIYNINKSNIFEWRNVSRLRWLGSLLLASFACTAVPKIVLHWGVNDMVELSKYIIAPVNLQITDLLLGIGCLIVAETFAIGLKIKEDQDLTI